jgi:antitoxin component YwqK of YwqJK toxin-antitoxin module
MKRIIFLLVFFSVSSCSIGQKVFNVKDSDTTFFDFKSVDGVEELFLKDTAYNDGKYVVHSYNDAKKIIMRFEIKNGKPCGEMIKYRWNGKVLYRKDYGKCN